MISAEELVLRLGGGRLGRPGRAGARAVGVGRRDANPRPCVVGLCAVHGGLHLRILGRPKRATCDPRSLPGCRAGSSGIGFIGAGTIIFRREIVKGLTTAASIWAVAAVGLAVGGGMFLAAVSATLLALALLVLARPVKQRLFPNRKEARRVRLILGRETSLAELRSEIEASEVPLERIVVRPGSSAEYDDAELVLGKGSQEEELLSLIEGLRRVSGVREVNSALMNGSGESQSAR